MAGTVSLTFSSVPKFSLKPIRFSHISTPFPSKRTRRKNYLRPKILKTLTKPLPSSTPTNPINPIESPFETKPLDVVVFEPPSSEQIDKVEGFQVSETPVVTGENNGFFGTISAHSVLKYGFYFVGAFILQTLIAVWVMGVGNSQDKDGNLRNGGGKRVKFLNNRKAGPSSRTVPHCDDSELAEKVEEIRAMAREARIVEKKGSKNGDEKDDMIDETLNSKSRIMIEKEISARLNKLERKLNLEESFPGSYMNLLDKFKDGEDVKEMSKTFVKKKFRFRGPEMSPRSPAKGFPGSKDGRKLSNKNGIATNVSRIEEVDDGKTVLNRNSDSLPSNRDIEEEELGSSHNNTSAGSEGGEERLSTEAIKSIKSRDLDTQNPKISKIKSDKRDFSHASKRKDVNNKPRADKVKDTRSGIKTDPWWLNLPYVLVILMKRDDDPEGLGGIFTMRLSSEEGREQNETSCTVAFEDRGDANNFCYLLECYFEDLGDFSAKVVPMSVKELRQADNSRASEVIVVKKGQLKLYAGQPFTEVEMALQSLIEDNHSAASIANSE